MADIMPSEDVQLAAFNIILYSGNARTKIHQAFSEMRKGDFDLSNDYLAQAKEEVTKAHQSQTELLQTYAAGTKIEMEIIMVHAQDHLMTTMTLQEVAEEMENLYKSNTEIKTYLKLD